MKNTKSERLFTVQKLCMRILFGDRDAYLDKFKTCSRAREKNNQKLGPGFFCMEHTKPLFNQMEILAFKNLYNYHICIDTLKTLKSRIPSCLYNLYTISTRNNQNLLLFTSRADTGLYISNRINCWNNCVKLIATSQKIHEIKISKFKCDLKKSLLEIQNSFDNIEWYQDLNFTL